MAKGNDGNYFQHSVETAVALHLTRRSDRGALHVALAHGMAPFEPCVKPPDGQSRRLLQEALEASRNAPTCGESPIVEAYRATKASLESYPNTGELLAAKSGRDRLSGGITEVDAQKYAKLLEVWSGSDVTPVNSSWRLEVCPGGVLSCPPTLRAPWLFSADPMTYQEDGYDDDDKLYREDLPRLSTTLKGFTGSGQPGVATLFVYAVRPDDQPRFWTFADDLAANSGMELVRLSVAHQGGNRNLGAVLRSDVELPACWLPHGVSAGR